MSRITRTIKTRPLLLSGVTALVILTGGIAVHQFSNASAQPSIVAETPAIPVSVETVNAGDVRVWSEFSGRLNAVDFAEIRPEVSGRITEVRFKDGQTVKAGDIMFVLD